MNKQKITYIALAVLVMGATTLASLQVAKAAVPSKENLTLANPIHVHKSFKEAEEALNFSIQRPHKVQKGFTRSAIETIDGELLQLCYSNEKADLKTVFRMAKGETNTSGDYREYPFKESFTIGESEVILSSSEKGKVSLATWTSDGYSFSFSFDMPVSKSVLKSLIKSIY